MTCYNLAFQELKSTLDLSYNMTCSVFGTRMMQQGLDLQGRAVPEPFW